jgi:Na+/H+ antiporter NhaC
LEVGKSEIKLRVWPGWVSVAPSLGTVLLAVWLKENVLSLLFGCWIANTFLFGGNVVTGLLRTVDAVVIEAIASTDHACIIYFILLIGGMIAVINQSGSMLGMARVVTRYANTKRSAEVVTAVIGCLSFFDDVASALITGSVMKDITGTLRTSREKLSFIVDTCAATVPSMIVVSSWIGVELSYIKDGFSDIKLEQDAYLTFIQTIPHRFYPMLMLLFCIMVIVTKRDFGPMWHAERRAFVTGKLVAENAQPLSSENDPGMKPKEGVPHRWINAVIPFVLVMVTIFAGIIIQGNEALASKASQYRDVMDRVPQDSTEWQEAKQHLDNMDLSLKAVFGAANPFQALIWASVVGSIVSIILVTSQRIMKLGEAMQAWTGGCKSMVFVVLILIHAWAFGNSCRELQTAQYIVSSLKGALPASLLSTLVFVLSAMVSFAIGSAWGTMSILFPIVIPLAHQLAPANWDAMVGTIASVLSGAALGNHTSPIADCCIMSSMSSGSDHSHHIRTQGVYAVVVALVAVFTGSLPVGFNLYPAWVGIIIGCCVLLGLLFVLGKRSDQADMSDDEGGSIL